MLLGSALLAHVRSRLILKYSFSFALTKLHKKSVAPLSWKGGYLLLRSQYSDHSAGGWRRQADRQTLRRKRDGSLKLQKIEKINKKKTQV